MSTSGAPTSGGPGIRFPYETRNFIGSSIIADAASVMRQVKSGWRNVIIPAYYFTKLKTA